MTAPVPADAGPPRPAAATAPDHRDAGLQGRTYAVPFEDVWQASLALAGGGLRGWSLISSNDQDGVIVSEARTLLLRFVDDVRIHVSLDADAQTRVDARSVSRRGVTDLGANKRRLKRFFRRLDREVQRYHSARTATAAPKTG